MDFVGKADGFVRSIAERLVGGMAAAAKRERRAAGQAERLALRIDDLELYEEGKAKEVFALPITGMSLASWIKTKRSLYTSRLSVISSH